MSWNQVQGSVGVDYSCSLPPPPFVPSAFVPPASPPLFPPTAALGAHTHPSWPLSILSPQPQVPNPTHFAMSLKSLSLHLSLPPLPSPYPCFDTGRLCPHSSLGHRAWPQPSLLTAVQSQHCCYRARLGPGSMSQTRVGTEPAGTRAMVGRRGRGLARSKG